MIPLSCTHDKLHPRSHSSAVASKLDLLRTKPHGSFAACETGKGDEDGFCDAVKLQDRNTFELYHEKLHPRSHCSADASKLDLLRSKSLVIQAILKTRKACILHTIRYLCGSSSSMTRAGSGFALRKLSRSLVTPGDAKLHDAHLSRR